MEHHETNVSIGCSSFAFSINEHFVTMIFSLEFFWIQIYLVSTNNNSAFDCTKLFNLVILNAYILNKHYGCEKLTHDEYTDKIVKYLLAEGLKKLQYSITTSK